MHQMPVLCYRKLTALAAMPQSRNHFLQVTKGMR